MAGNWREYPETVVPSFLFLTGELCTFKHHSHHQNVIISSNSEMFPKRALVSNITSEAGRSPILPAQVLSSHAFFQSYPQEEWKNVLLFCSWSMNPFTPRKKQSKRSRNIVIIQHPDETIYDN